MKKRKAKIIKDKKRRGEWAESVFIARAAEEGLPASKPWGDSRSFDCVVGTPGKFVAVQVKCTIFKNPEGEGYICTVCSCNRPYRPGSFDFLAAYVVPEDAWYIIPEKKIRGRKSISLCTDSGEAKYEGYREAWHLLREATASKEPETAEEKADGPPDGSRPTGALGRFQSAGNYFKRYLERSGVDPQKESEDT